jgi:hypothetical protein
LIALPGCILIRLQNSKRLNANSSLKKCTMKHMLKLPLGTEVRAQLDFFRRHSKLARKNHIRNLNTWVLLGPGLWFVRPVHGV